MKFQFGFAVMLVGYSYTELLPPFV